MVNFPFSPFPYYYNNCNYIHSMNHPSNQKQKIPKHSYYNVNKESSYKTNHYNNINLSNLFSGNINEPVIEIFGITLYLDDIIIIFLLFFLYNEGVKDDILFIILFLLLIS